jgi:hypothetical protein
VPPKQVTTSPSTSPSTSPGISPNTTPTLTVLVRFVSTDSLCDCTPVSCHHPPASSVARHFNLFVGSSRDHLVGTCIFNSSFCVSLRVCLRPYGCAAGKRGKGIGERFWSDPRTRSASTTTQHATQHQRPIVSSTNAIRMLRVNQQTNPSFAFAIRGFARDLDLSNLCGEKSVAIHRTPASNLTAFRRRLLPSSTQPDHKETLCCFLPAVPFNGVCFAC